MSTLVFVCVACLSPVNAATLDDCSPAELALYFTLAEAAKAAYDDAAPELVTTPAGCAARVTVDAAGNMVIAFRGSMLTDRTRKSRFSTFGGATMRRNYRDWAATNLKQAAGFLPRQYVEAAELVESYLQSHPVDKCIYITGHSKGGGVATYAAVSACLSKNVDLARIQRVTVVTFNAAVVRRTNWRRLFRRHGDIGMEEAVRRIGQTDGIAALVMRDDPVSKIGDDERAEFERDIIMAPTRVDMPPMEQHEIDAVIAALAVRLDAVSTHGGKAPALSGHNSLPER